MREHLRRRLIFVAVRRLCSETFCANIDTHTSGEQLSPRARRRLQPAALAWTVHIFDGHDPMDSVRAEDNVYLASYLLLHIIHSHFFALTFNLTAHWRAKTRLGFG